MDAMYAYAFDRYLSIMRRDYPRDRRVSCYFCAITRITHSRYASFLCRRPSPSGNDAWSGMPICMPYVTSSTASGTAPSGSLGGLSPSPFCGPSPRRPIEMAVRRVLTTMTQNPLMSMTTATTMRSTMISFRLLFFDGVVLCEHATTAGAACNNV